MICILFLFHFCSPAFLLQQVVKLFFGCVAAVACGMLYAVYLSTYHERKFWFSTKQVCDFSQSTKIVFHPVVEKFTSDACFAGTGA